MKDEAMSIPKTIHYCWFGGSKLPNSAEKCIDSWKKHLPEHEIKRWDESNFDVNMISYTRAAYKAKKYAFVSDYARYWILYNHGGLYFDTDVEIISGIDDIIAQGAFMGCETPCRSNEDVTAGNSSVRGVPWVNPGLGLGISKDHDIIGEILTIYDTMEFTLPDHKSELENVVSITTRVLYGHGFKNSPDIQSIKGINIYPSDYFCPISTEDGKLRLTSNTRSIHWFDQSWQSPARKYGRKIILAVGGVKVKRILKRLLYQ